MEAELLRGFRRGERAALERVYREAVHDVERLVRQGLRGIGKLTGANLEDVVQDVFLRALSDMARASYDGERAFAPYVATIARNVLSDWARRCGREIPMSDLIEPLAEDRAGDVTSLEGIEALEPARRSVMARYLATLPSDLRLIHQHRFVRAQSQRDAAEAIGITRQKLRTLEGRLVEGLRRALRRAGLGVERARPAR